MKNKLIFIKQILFLFLFVISSGSLAAEPKPDWVKGDASVYPNNQYMSATGSASNEELAKNRALANLSKIFETHIKVLSINRSDTQVTEKNDEENISKKNSLSQKIELRTDKIISGAQIAEVWEDETLFTYHALAILDRTQAGNNIKDELQRIDRDTQIQIERSKKEKDVLLSLSALNKAVVLQFERQTLHKALKVIDVRGKGEPPKWSLAELQGQLEKQYLSLSIGTAVDADPVGGLDQLLKSAMGNAGFSVGDESSQFTLVANLDVQDLGFRQGWYWLRGKLSVKMIESNGRIRGRVQWPIKVSALKHGDAESRLMTQVSKKLDAEIKSTIFKFSTGSK